MYHQVPQHPPSQVWAPPMTNPSQIQSPNSYSPPDSAASHQQSQQQQYETNVSIPDSAQHMRMRPHHSPTADGTLPLPSTFLSNPVAQFALNTYGSQLKSRLGGLFGWKSAFSPYFHVNHYYVVHKLKILLLPFTHRNWRRERLDGWPDSESLNGSNGPAMQQQAQQAAALLDPSGYGYKTPAHDLNAPDLYIPLMSFITLVLLLAFRAAYSLSESSRSFDPELIGQIAITLCIYIAMEMFAIYAGLWVISSKSAVNSIWDLMAYCAYKFWHCILIVLFSFLTSSSLLYYVTLLTFSCLQSLFMMRTMKRALTPAIEHQSNMATFNNLKRNYMLLTTGALQIVFCWLACRAA